LVDSLVVVTRYFGGTKLGVGGLIRAYGGTAGEAIQAVQIQTMTSVDIVELEFAYSDQSVLRTLVHASNGIFDGEVYTDVVSWRVLLRPEFSTIFTEQCFDRTSGRVMPQINGQKLIMIES
jgi:putative IMPACT (imprinted ancient) family translation regulator